MNNEHISVPRELAAILDHLESLSRIIGEYKRSINHKTVSGDIARDVTELRSILSRATPSDEVRDGMWKIGSLIEHLGKIKERFGNTCVWTESFCWGSNALHAYDKHKVLLDDPSLSDETLRTEWRALGGSIHGPNVETVTMPESSYFAFRRSLSNKPTAPRVVTAGLEDVITKAICDWGDVGSEDVRQDHVQFLANRIRESFATSLPAAIPDAFIELLARAEDVGLVDWTHMESESWQKMRGLRTAIGMAKMAMLAATPRHQEKG